MNNIFENVPVSLPKELVSVLVENGRFRIERIVSTGHSSSPGFWYDQEENEWVMVAAGKARITFEGGSTVELRPGDNLLIEAHQRHRVEWTSPDEPTIWLAVFY